MTTGADRPRGLRILVVDDTEAVRAMVRIGLELDGRFTDIAEAANGRDAIEAATFNPPDVILLDDMMPVMTGVEALPVLRSTAPAARIVVYSAIANEIELVQVTAADACVPKGTDLCVLYDLLAEPHPQRLAS